MTLVSMVILSVVVAPGCMPGSPDKSDSLVIVSMRWACPDTIDFLFAI